MAIAASMPISAAGVLETRGVVDEVARGRDLDRHVGQLELHGLLVSERLPERPRAPSRACTGHVVRALCDPEPRAPIEMRPPSSVFMKVAKPSPSGPEQVIARDACILEDEAGPVGTAHAELLLALLEG